MVAKEEENFKDSIQMSETNLLLALDIHFIILPACFEGILRILHGFNGINFGSFKNQFAMFKMNY